jgi:hypothetical protein
MHKTGTKPIPTAAFERHFTIPELSELWSIDPGAVRHMFKDEPTVVRVQTAPKGNKRSCTTYSIPESTALRIYLCHTGAAGDDAAPAEVNTCPACGRRIGVKSPDAANTSQPLNPAKSVQQASATGFSLARKDRR